ncbi:MAG: ester cyclase [Chloroflexi bacterium]|nr:MAG: ester cyclase [Chloroflexota bacterium]
MARGFTYAGYSGNLVRVHDVVRRYVGAAGARDVEACMQCFASDATFVDPGKSAQLDRGGIEKEFQGVFAAFPDATFETLALDPISNEVAAWRWTLRGTNTGQFAGGPPTGRAIELSGCEFIQVREGLIWHVTAYFDRLRLVAQLGFASDPALPTPAKD